MTVVNNREDRIARSRVFARIVVEDLNADAHVCIGTNLGGLRAMIEEALDEWLATQAVADDWNEGEGRDAAVARFWRMIARLRIGKESIEPERMLHVAAARGVSELGRPPSWASARARLKAAISSSRRGGEKIDDLWDHFDRLSADARRVRRAIEGIRDAGSAEEANTIFREQYRKLFLSRILYIGDPQATGDQIIDQATGMVPPGSRVHLIGLQNIKGTGLDFVYRWVSVGRIEQLLQRAERDPSLGSSVVGELARYPSYGVADAQLALDALRDPTRFSDVLEDEVHGAALSVASARAKARKGLALTNEVTFVDRVLGAIERWIDPFDSILRSREAARIRRELIKLRVGKSKAAAEMVKLTKRDKGGWLAPALRRSLANLKEAFKRLFGGPPDGPDERPAETLAMLQSGSHASHPSHSAVSR